MLTQDVTQQLEAIIEQLVVDGKEPTVALVKARLGQPVPMPALIATIKAWKSSKRVPKVEIVATLSTEDRIKHLEQQVEQLLARVAQLEANNNGHQQ